VSDETQRLTAKVRELGPWFHQLDLGNGVLTRNIKRSPGPQPVDHPIPRWHKIRDTLPEDMHGMTVLDVGCSDGFFSFEMARRGAEVLAVDAQRSAIRRLRWAQQQLGVEGVESMYGDIYAFDKGITLYDRSRHWLMRRLWMVWSLLTRGHLTGLDYTPRRFDMVFMFALLYHMKEPLLALERLVPLADILLVESAAVDDEANSALVFQPPKPGVTDNPKWFPTTRCIKDMLLWAGYDEVREIASAEDKRPIYVAWKHGADLRRWHLPI
jgi:SAM-dependent methyltransferase